MSKFHTDGFYCLSIQGFIILIQQVFIPNQLELNFKNLYLPTNLKFQ